jgi:spermidine synthase
VGGAPINLDDLTARLASPQYAKVVESLQSIGFRSLEELFATYAVGGADLQTWLADAQINRDRNLRLEFLAGLGLNQYQEDAIYQQMVAFRRYPASLFAGSPERLAALSAAMGGGQ